MFFRKEMLKIGSTFYVSENAGQPKENMEDEADNVDPAGGSDTCAAIGAYAFRNCKSLIQIRLPKDCEIADTAFAGCTSLVAIFAPAGGTTETWAKEHGIPFVPTDRIEIIISVDPPPVIVAGV